VTQLLFSPPPDGMLIETVTGQYQERTCVQCSMFPTTHICKYTVSSGGVIISNGDRVCGSFICDICNEENGYECITRCKEHSNSTNQDVDKNLQNNAAVPKPDSSVEMIEVENKMYSDAELNLMLLPKLRDLVSDKKLSKGVSRLTKPMCLELLQKHQLTCRLQMLVKTENELIDRAFNNTLERVDFAIKILTDAGADLPAEPRACCYQPIFGTRKNETFF